MSFKYESIGIMPSVTKLDWVLWIHRKTVVSSMRYDFTPDENYFVEDQAGNCVEAEKVTFILEPVFSQVFSSDTDEAVPPDIQYEVQTYLEKHADIFEAFWRGDIKTPLELMAAIKPPLPHKQYKSR